MNSFTTIFTTGAIGFNISGPDTFRNQEEKNLLVQLYQKFTDNLNLELGYYHSKADIEERNVSLRTFWNENDDWGILPRIPGRFDTSYIDWTQNPEVMAYNGATDIIGYGVGEAFIFNRIQTVQSPTGPGYFHASYDPPLPASEKFTTAQIATVARAYAGYYWYHRPTSSTSDQLRARLAYEIDSNFLDVPAKHTFVLGHNFIQDEVHYVTGVGNPGYVYDVPGRISLKGGTYPTDRLVQDGLILRDSVLDLEPIRLRPGDTISEAINISYTDFNSGTTNVARSGYRDDTLWFRGTYGIYRGQFWNDKLTVIAGVRRDSYQGREKERLLALDRDQLTRDWLGSNGQAAKYYIPEVFTYYGDKPWTPRADFPDALNQKIADSITQFRYSQDEEGNYTVPERLNGTIEHTFDHTQTFNTKTAGISYRVIDPVSVYVAYSEGVFPNIGARDGNYKAIGPEESTSKEIGMRFDLLDGKISGSFALWEINRTNAVTSFNYAPAPSTWHGGEREPSDPNNPYTFSPLNTYKEHTLKQFPPYSGNLDPGDPDLSQYRSGIYRSLSYGVAVRYVERALELLGYPAPHYPAGQPSISDFAAYTNPGDIMEILTGSPNIGTGLPEETPSNMQIMVVDYNQALKDADPNTSVLKKAFELAMVNEPVHGEPVSGGDIFSGPLQSLGSAGLVWYSFNNSPYNNPSSPPFNTARTVTFEEQGKGIDGEITFTPTPSWQVVFQFSHQKRQISGNGFNLVDPIAPDGINYGTEYDVWNYVLGRENFADPTRPSTYNGASLKGLDLSHVPRTSLGLLTRYAFRDNLLEGLTVGGGVRYESSVETTTPIGGTYLVENQYLPPRRPERYEFNAFLRYRFELAKVAWSFQVNVNNLLNNRTDEAIKSYDSNLDVPILRRTLIYYDPRTWRFSLTASF